jgi:DNA-binding NarL/FixJ family response regulator
VAKESAVGKMEPVAGSVLVVDDDDFTRTLVATMVEAFGLDVVASASAVTEAMSLAHELQPGLAVVDLDLGEGPTGVDLAHGLRTLNASIALVMLTSYGHPTWMGQHREPPPGTRYVVKGEVKDRQILADAISSALADPLANDASARRGTPLSESQWEILRLVASGFSNAEIARRRSITDDAVNRAISRLTKQLHIDAGKEGNTRVLLAQAYNRITGSSSERRN